LLVEEILEGAVFRGLRTASAGLGAGRIGRWVAWVGVAWGHGWWWTGEALKIVLTCCDQAYSAAEDKIESSRGDHELS
jgi:hypothetical protein